MNAQSAFIEKRNKVKKNGGDTRRMKVFLINGILMRVKEILPDITSRKMMGEYLLYKDGKLFGGIYDNRLLLKTTKVSVVVLKFHDSAFPYQGGGEMISFPEPYDAVLLRDVVAAMLPQLPKKR